MSKIKNVSKSITGWMKRNSMFINLLLITVLAITVYGFLSTNINDANATVGKVTAQYKEEVIKNAELQDKISAIETEMGQKDATIKTLNENYEALNKQMTEIIKALKN